MKYTKAVHWRAAQPATVARRARRRRIRYARRWTPWHRSLLDKSGGGGLLKPYQGFMSADTKPRSSKRPPPPADNSAGSRQPPAAREGRRRENCRYGFKLANVNPHDALHAGLQPSRKICRRGNSPPRRGAMVGYGMIMKLNFLGSYKFVDTKATRVENAIVPPHAHHVPSPLRQRMHYGCSC
jgi:hypothetical protein